MESEINPDLYKNFKTIYKIMNFVVHYPWVECRLTIIPLCDRVLEHGNVTSTEAARGEIFIVVLSQVLRNEGFEIPREVEASIFSSIINSLSSFIAF